MSLRRLSVMIRRTQDLEPKRAMFKIKWRREWNSNYYQNVARLYRIRGNILILTTFLPTLTPGFYGISWDHSARDRRDLVPRQYKPVWLAGARTALRPEPLTQWVTEPSLPATQCPFSSWIYLKSPYWHRPTRSPHLCLDLSADTQAR